MYGTTMIHVGYLSEFELITGAHIWDRWENYGARIANNSHKLTVKSRVHFKLDSGHLGKMC